MARQSSAAAQRNLSVTEELEKLEQSITLTLQEIDHNFSRAHRIVTTSILPVVEKYRENSENVWEASKFWKQFFEASANVSLSGYEESPPDGEEEEDETISASSISASAQTTPSTSTYTSPPQPQHNRDETATPSARDYMGEDEYTLSPPQTTPRQQSKPSKTGSTMPLTAAPYSSPYENLRRETLEPSDAISPSESELPSTPGVAVSPQKGRGVPPSSPFAPPSTRQRTAQRTPANDVLLHRVLDKNWRIQATPHSALRVLPHAAQPRRAAEEQQTTPRPSAMRKAQRNRHALADDLDSSPAVPAPQLHAELFDTPAGKGRVPGVSVLTPGKGAEKEDMMTMGSSSRYRDDLWNSDEDADAGAGISPPKTMQFHVPQSRLVRTPAREASRKIVEDLLATAGMRDGLEETEAEEADSPSIVQRGGLLEEDTF